MAEWDRVKWSEARQVAAILGWEEEGAPAPYGSPPHAYFHALRERGRREEAAAFMGQALPRLEAVAWAARAVRDLKGDPGAGAESAALRAALLWVQDPSESRRRRAFEAAAAADAGSAEALAAMAAFYSGGSVAPPQCPPLPAPREAAGRFASGAVMVAAAGASDPRAALDACLDQGEQLAARGLGEASA